MTEDRDPAAGLARFVEAQAPVIDGVLLELADARKTSHWMWFVFPQLRGLGLSARAQYFGISGSAEAQAFLAHPVLGPRLLRCTKLVLDARPRTLGQVFGTPDDLKFRSCMTLFAAIPDAPAVFGEALAGMCSGTCARTEALLREG